MTDDIKSPVLRFLVYGHVWLALGAAAQVAWIGKWFFVAPDLRMALVAGFGAIAVYGVMRMFRMGDPGLQGSPLIQWYRANTRGMVLVVAVSGALALFFAWPTLTTIITALWKPGLLAALYLLPAVWTAGRSIGLRSVPFLKAFIIAYAWASVTTLLPGVAQTLDGDQVQGGLWWMFAVQFCFFLALAIVFDIRDLPYDTTALRTVPQLVGVRGAKLIALLLLLPICFLHILMAWMVFDPVDYAATGEHIDLAYALPLVALIGLGVAIVKAENAQPWWYFPVLVDGVLVFVPLLAWLGSML